MSLETEILERLAEMPRHLRAVATELVGQERFCPSSKAKAFSLLEHACHLRDLEEEAFTLRIRRILREDNPNLSDFDGATVAAERNYLAQDFTTALRDFEAARQHNLETLSALGSVALERAGELAGRGKTTLRRLAQLMLEHDNEHAAEISDLLTAAGKGPRR